MKALLRVIETKEYYEKVVIPSRDSTISLYNDALSMCKSTITSAEAALNSCSLSIQTKQSIIDNNNKIINIQKKKIRGKNVQIITAVIIGIVAVSLK